jgi:hypothetical protein
MLCGDTHGGYCLNREGMKHLGLYNIPDDCRNQLTRCKPKKLQQPKNTVAAAKGLT